VIVAAHRYCIGVGVLLAGAADILIAGAETRFVMAEIDNGATGGAIQASGLMPEKRLRAAMFTCEPVSAEELQAYGSIYELVPDDELPCAARRVATLIASKPSQVVRRAKSSINNSIGSDIRRLYRVEMSYTYELNLLGEAAAARQTFLDGERGSYTAD
jgi:enoyl-CoA hydratase